MAAVAHALPADILRLTALRTSPVGMRGHMRAPATVYRRRQALAVLVVVSALAALILAMGGMLASFGLGAVTGPSGQGTPARVYVVQPGDTFWEIAQRLRPDEDPRPLVARLVAAHGSPTLVAGERLSLPAAA